MLCLLLIKCINTFKIDNTFRPIILIHGGFALPVAHTNIEGIRWSSKTWHRSMLILGGGVATEYSLHPGIRFVSHRVSPFLWLLSQRAALFCSLQRCIISSLVRSEVFLQYKTLGCEAFSPQVSMDGQSLHGHAVTTLHLSVPKANRYSPGAERVNLTLSC